MIALLAFSASVSTAFAQATPTATEINKPIILETTPTSPLPNTPVTVRAKSFVIDLNRASISWSVDGAVVAQGTATTEITFDLGDVGSAAVVRVTATEAGVPYSAELVIRPAVVDILWQADTYVPPFYDGKALASSEAPVRLIAVPDIRVDGQRIAPSNLVYTWKQGSRVLGNQSGYGRSSIVLPAPRLIGKESISVIVEAQDASIRALGFIDMRSVRPDIVFYEDDPVLGIRYETALDEQFNLAREEVVVTAHPYYLTGNKRRNPNAQYEWQVDGEPVSNTLSDESSIVFRQTGGAGSASISLSITHMAEVLQRAQGRFTIRFSGINQTGF